MTTGCVPKSSASRSSPSAAPVVAIVAAAKSETGYGDSRVAVPTTVTGIDPTRTASDIRERNSASAEAAVMEVTLRPRNARATLGRDER